MTQSVPPVIRTPDQRLRVFVSSTLQEVADERQAARQAIEHLRLAPVMFELGARPHPPKDLYRAYLDQSDIFVGIYWQRYGWVAPDMDISGLEDEWRLSGDRPKLIYIKAPAPDRDSRLKELLDKVRNDDRVSYKPFSTPDELRDLIENDLAMMLTERFEMAAATATPLPEAPETRRGNLPLPPTRLIGRETELAALHDRLRRDEAELVTLTGPGGTGKTRLALQAARDVADHFEDGAFFVALAPLSDPDLVASAIAATLGVRETTGSQSIIESLKSHLRDKHSLLLLDNFEQIVEAAPVVADLSQACRRLQLLVTSRAPLHLRGEREFPVAPLALPDHMQLPQLDRLSQYAAVELFIQRAIDVQPDFAITNENAPAIAEICYRLDGLPLAIELAAARIKLLTPQTMLNRLERRLPLLIGGARDLPARQQTLRNTIDWSYNLLDEHAKKLFRRLAVFVGGWTLEAAEAVCNLDGDLGGELLDEMEALADNSLLKQRSDQGDEIRFGMLVTLREYATERLAENPVEAERIRQQHATFFRQLAETAEPKFTSIERFSWLPRMEPEHDNLRAALAWSRSQPDPDSELCLVGALAWYWYFGGFIGEGRTQAEHALLRLDPADRTRRRALVLFSAGALASAHADYTLGRDRLIECAALFRELGDLRRAGYALNYLAMVIMSLGDPQLAERTFRDSIDSFKAAQDQWGHALALGNYAEILLMVGEISAARLACEEGLRLWRSVGDTWGEGNHLCALGSVEWYDGQIEASRLHCQTSVDLLRAHGDRWGLARALNRLGFALIALHEVPRAEACFTESLELWQLMGNRRGIIHSLIGLGGIAANGGQPDRAARLLGAVECLSRQALYVAYGLDRARYERTFDQARSQLDEAIWHAAFSLGQTMTLEQAIKQALNVNEQT